MARRNIKRASPPRWTREGKRLKGRSNKLGSEAPEARVEPVVVEVQEEPEPEVASQAKAPAKKSARSSRRRRSSKVSSSSSK